MVSDLISVPPSGSLAKNLYRKHFCLQSKWSTVASSVQNVLQMCCSSNFFSLSFSVLLFPACTGFTLYLIIFYSAFAAFLRKCSTDFHVAQTQTNATTCKSHCIKLRWNNESSFDVVSFIGPMFTISSLVFTFCASQSLSYRLEWTRSCIGTEHTNATRIVFSTVNTWAMNCTPFY